MIVLIGPAIEEIVFRGYLLTLLLHLPRHAPPGNGKLAVVLTAALIFAAAHAGNPGVTRLQLICITATGSLYGWLRLKTGSIAAGLVTHSTYNLVLCLNSWLGS
jgi:membrane protease YdiL (CAAX protease family)